MAQQAAHEDEPRTRIERLRAIVGDLTDAIQANRDDMAALRARASRTTTVAVPELGPGTPVEIAVTWHPAMPDATYRVSATWIHGPGLLGRLQVAVKPGSKTTTGCALIIAATAAVTAGQAGLDVVATP